MNIYLIGNNLTSLVLANVLVNRRLKVCLYYEKHQRLDLSTRTIAISNANHEFLKKEISKLKTLKPWVIESMKIFSEINNYEKILEFNERKSQLFFMFQYEKLFKLFEGNLKKNKLFKKKKLPKNIKMIINQKQNLFVNCDSKNLIFKNYFSDGINKDYKSFAFTTILNHKKIENYEANQIFTKFGPIAFLPLSMTKTAIVFSLNKEEIFNKENDVKDLIRKHNKFYKITSIGKIKKFPLKLFLQKKYFYKNILSFGDTIHQIHPLAGQGFNMTLRDAKVLNKLIKEKTDLGLQIDNSIFLKFEKKTKHLNLLFSKSIDLIYEIFKKTENSPRFITKNIFKSINKNNYLKTFFIRSADEGL